MHGQGRTAQLNTPGEVPYAPTQTSRATEPHNPAIIHGAKVRAAARTAGTKPRNCSLPLAWMLDRLCLSDTDNFPEQVLLREHAQAASSRQIEHLKTIRDGLEQNGLVIAPLPINA